jgi:hypothetical protein
MIDGAQGSRSDTIVNNTIVQAADGRWCVNIKNGSTGTVVRNNILYNNHSFRGSISMDAASMSGLKSDYNVLMDRLTPDDDNTMMTLSQWRAATGLDAHSLTAAPALLFANAAADDYHLRTQSPAIDGGTGANAPSFDLESKARPVNGLYDIGCYEFGDVSVRVTQPRYRQDNQRTYTRCIRFASTGLVTTGYLLNGRMQSGGVRSVLIAGMRIEENH